MGRVGKLFVAALTFFGVTSTLFAGNGEGAAASGVGIGFVLLYIAIVVAMLAGFWKVFVKADKPGWAVLIPIYNVIVMLEIAGRPLWWIILMFIPIVNVVISIIVSIDIANKFGKGAGFGLGLAFLGFIFYPILGFGDSKYMAESNQGLDGV